MTISASELSYDDIRALHERVAPSPMAVELIYTHCRIVADIAQWIVEHNHLEHECNVDLLIKGALLHDIGTYKVLQPIEECSGDNTPKFNGPLYITHGLLGYNLLKSQGFDDQISLFARNHTGIGLTKAMVKAQHLPLPIDDYIPENMEQEIVMYADKFHSKSNPPKFLTAEAYRRKSARFGEDNAAAFMELVQRYGEPPIHDFAQHYGMGVRE